MKFLICLLAVVAVAVARPQQREGEQFTNEAIQQAQNSFLIPRNAQIQGVVQGIELAAYENLPGNQPIDLQGILGDLIPHEVVQNLQPAVNDIGRT